MRALTLTSFGGLDGVVLTDVAEPEMPDDAVTVRVHAVALAKWVSPRPKACSSRWEG